MSGLAADGAELWLIRLPGNVDAASLDGVTVPAGFALDAGVGFKAANGRSYTVNAQSNTALDSAIGRARALIGSGTQLKQGRAFSKLLEVVEQSATVPKVSLSGSMVNRKPNITQPTGLGFRFTPFGAKKVAAGTTKKVGAAGKAVKPKKEKKAKKSKKERK